MDREAWRAAIHGVAPSPFHFLLQTLKGSVFPGSSVVKDLPAMQETQVQSLGGIWGVVP